jgi:hypothetical protein
MNKTDVADQDDPIPPGGLDEPGWLPRPGITALLAFLAVVLLQALVGFRAEAPLPWMHDEEAYLLGADTLLLGRLSNPTPPSPEHFEMIHVLVEPRYASKYPLGQPAFLALGKALLGSAHRGVILSVALGAAAAAWAGAGWAGRRGALAAGLLFVLNFGTGHYWVRSYWGGGVVVLGSFLVLGAYPRLRRSWGPEGVLTLAAGLGLLFFTRPFEGGVLGMTVLSFLVPVAWKAFRRFPLRIGSALAALIVLGSGFVALQLLVNEDVTGSWKELPYQAHVRRYLAGPLFWFSPLGEPPTSTVPESLAVNRWEIEVYRAKNLLPPWAAMFSFGAVASVFAWPRLLPLAVLAWRPARLSLPQPGGFALLVAATSLTWLAVALETYRYEHYLAPFVAGLFLLQAYAWSAASRVPGKGRWLGSAIAVLLLLETRNSVRPYLRLLSEPESFPIPPRHQVSRRLDAENGKHLVFVRWNGPISPHTPWIANTVPLEEQRILWVRDLGREENARVVDAFPDRRRWLCIPDPPAGNGPSLTPMPRE